MSDTGDTDLRRRKKTTSKTFTDEHVKQKKANNYRQIIKDEVLPGTFWLTRIILLRATAFVYFVAFLVGFHQNKGLLGINGLLPANLHLKAVEKRNPNNLLKCLESAPTLLWLFNYDKNLDFLMWIIAVSGMILSAQVFITAGSNMFTMTLIWVLYHSLVNVGQTWYSFGWESQILETGFLAIFLVPLFSCSSLPKKTPPSYIVIWGYRWLIFRIMIGAGMIKMRGDKCWWPDLTCMNYHYETQPVPNPIAYYLHQSPEFIHKAEVLGNHFVELVAPFFILMGRRMCIIGGVIQVLFQVVLIVSGNLSFLNWLTIIPALACFDDRSLTWLFPRCRGGKIEMVNALQSQYPASWMPRVSLRGLLNCIFGATVVYLSVPIVQNLLSSRQVMNTSFEPLRIVNTYGAFGSITKERTEVIFQGTNDDPRNPNADWKEYQFKCKPGAVDRRPCLISPYHYRLDWLMWFAAFQNYQYNPWLVHLAYKLLVNDEVVTSLMDTNPFHGGNPPKFVRAEHFRYVYTKLGSKEAEKGQWWKRSHIGNYLPAIGLSDLKQYMDSMGWKQK